LKRTEIAARNGDNVGAGTALLKAQAYMKELIVPPAALRDKQSIEMMRVWIAEKGLHCSLNIGIYSSSPSTSEERAWGIILADATRHVSDALAKSNGSSIQDSLSLIRENFLRELDKPTSKTSGDFVGDN
jgi:hypothetical protein